MAESKLIKLLRSLRNSTVYSKIFLQRTMSWIAIANAGMILFLVLSKLQDYGYSIYITKWYFPILIVCLIIMLLLGYLEDKLGFHSEEHRLTSKRNPYFDDIVNRLDRIEKELKNGKKKK